MRKIVFFHMNQLGDLLFSLPVLAAVRREFEDAGLYSVIRPQYAPLLSAAGLVDEVVHRPAGRLGAKIPLVRRLRGEKFSDAVFFSESPGSMLLGFAASARRRIGFATSSFSFLLTEKVERSGVPSLDNNRRLGIRLGLKNIPDDYTGLVKVPSSAAGQADDWINRHASGGLGPVAIAPGTGRRRTEKRWPDADWIKFGSALASAGFCPFFAGAPSEKKHLENLAILSSLPVFPSENGILSFAAVLSRSRLFVGPDSGAMHLAAALGVTVVALFGPTDPSAVGPRPLSGHIVIKKNSMEEIAPDEVIEAALGAKRGL